MSWLRSAQALTDEAITGLDTEVDVDGEEPADVAAVWLVKEASSAPDDSRLTTDSERRGSGCESRWDRWTVRWERSTSTSSEPPASSPRRGRTVRTWSSSRS